MVELTNTQLKVRRSLQNFDEDSIQRVLGTESPIGTTTSGSEPDLENCNQQAAQNNSDNSNINENQQLESITEHKRLLYKKDHHSSASVAGDADSVTTASSSKDYSTTGDLFLSTSSSSNYISDTTSSENQKLIRDLNETELNFELFNSSLNNHHTSESKQSEAAYFLSTPVTSASEKFELLQGHLDGDATTSLFPSLSADHRLHFKHQQNFNSSSSSSSSIGGCLSGNTNSNNNKLGYQLRALNENISAWETNPWFRAPTLPNNTNVSSLSTELVNETLNYFVNCGQRLSQMTKTYDDNDAYILLLQEKEVDLELAARIGQDLLRQNKELKDSIKNLEDELAKRQDDVQQLKHELASKISLLDTFIEEEQHQTSLAENEDESTLRQNELLNRPTTSNGQQPKYFFSGSSLTPDPNNDDDCPNGFLSLNFNNPKSANSLVEPFSSLPPCPTTSGPFGELTSLQALHREDSSSTISDDLNSPSRAHEQQKLVQTVTFQLVESNKRLCELQDELIYKSEQNLMQQEKIYNLQEQLRESDRRLGDVAAENGSLQKSILESAECQRELSEELKTCKRNFSDLLSVFLELQKESRIFRNTTMLHNSNLNYCGEIDPVNDISNISFDSFKPKSLDHANNGHATSPDICSTSNNNTPNTNQLSSIKTTTKIKTTENRDGTSKNKNLPMSMSLMEELQESMHRIGGVKCNLILSSDDEEGGCDSDGGHSEGDATDGGDSGVHTNHNGSSSTSPYANGLTTDNDSEEPAPSEVEMSNNNSKNWIGFSSFMLTTLLLLCLSMTCTSSPNLNLAHRLQIKLDR